MNGRGFLQHVVAAVATVSIGTRLQNPLPVIDMREVDLLRQSGMVGWRCWYENTTLNDKWMARVGPGWVGP